MERIGKYVIRRVIPGSGAARVHLCQDPDLQVPVAVKLLQAKADKGSPLSHGQWKSRLESEARALAAFDHPHIVPVKALDQMDGRPYIVMPCQAGDLRLEIGLDRANADTPDADLPRRVSVQRAVSILRQTAAALVALHRRGMVHRHVCPGNLLLTAKENGQIRLAGFGMVKLPERNPPLPDHWIGLPDYCAPEQRDAATAVGPQADVFSLGVLAWRLLTGHVPNLADLGGAPLAAPTDASPELAALIQSCTDPDPARRPASGAVVLQALGAITVAPKPRPTVQVVQIKKGLVVHKPATPLSA